MKHINYLNENVINFLEFSLLENRIEDLKIKYEKEFGDKADDLFNIDYTENKAYSEWLFKFYKNNKDEIEKEIPFEHFEVLELMLKKYHNNNFSTPITQIKTLKDFRKVIDEKDGFDKIENFPKDEVEILLNNNQWIIFKPLTYEVSQFANRKSRKSNWCTTYDDLYFEKYMGKKGGLIYCTNKLDSVKDISLEIKCNSDIINLWDYRDTNTERLSDSELADYFEYQNEDVYDVFKEYEIEHPTYTRSEMITLVHDDFNWYDTNIDYDILSDLFNKTTYLSDYVGDEIEYLSRQTEELIERCGYKSDVIITFLKTHVDNNELLKIFDVEDFNELNQYNFVDDVTLLELINEKELGGEFANFIITDHYKDHTCTDLFEELYGNFHDLEISELIEQIEKFVDEDDYFKEWISRMSDYDLLQYMYDNDL